MTIQPWLPGFVRVDLDLTGIESPEVGNPYDETSHPKVCWHTTEGTSLSGAETAFAKYPPHVGVHYETRERRQYLPLDKCSFSLKGSESDDEFIIQVEIVGFARESHNWSDAKVDWLGTDVLAPICKATGCPTNVVAQGFHGEGEGFILASPDSPIRFASEAALRAFSGQMGHQHAPDPDSHWDPGGFDAARAKQAADRILYPTVPKEEINVKDAINFFVRNEANGAVLFVMRNFTDPYRPFATMGVDGTSFDQKPEGTLTWGVSQGDFSFYERYRIDNIPEHETSV